MNLKKLFLMQITNGISEEIYTILDIKDKQKLKKEENMYYLKKEYRNKLKIVITGGVFDIIHYGHIYTLEKAKERGDILIVIVANDKTVFKNKTRKPIHSQEHRQKIVSSLKPVDLCLIGEEDPIKMTEKINPDLIVYGYDQKPFITNYPYIKLDKTEEYKTSKIIEELGI
ncbi:adenylyltransferase/cytidyltransferase family protein [Candidatus Micrarchaeota archaeon]|jgi:glycerol-3-phosphate cytidylyltransferase/FAD synthetase|nr:adenylyltransferase/cytidyltransferase family protein [Candidatus Micrarchaeota archaeon]